MSSKANITLKIDTRLLKEIKVLAAREDTSISALTESEKAGTTGKLSGGF
jgi:hypothetical protein